MTFKSISSLEIKWNEVQYWIGAVGFVMCVVEFCVLVYKPVYL